ncbi:MAG: phosphate ABC transporter substrate-binding protein [Gemmatimonadota bacterium]
MTRILIAVFAAALIHVPGQAQQEAVAVIVHASNPTASLAPEEVSRMLLKREMRWSNGAVVAPVDLPGGSKVREAFTRQFHRRSTDAIHSYWQQQIFSGRETPPPERATEAEVIAFVAATPHAIGYVSASARLPAGVKVVEVRAP